jgi:outer membrane protein assembly factor BamD (BamD/ComL family)
MRIKTGRSASSSLRIVIVLGFLIGAGGAGELSAQQWALSYFRGLQSLKNKQWDQAIRQLSNTINAHPASESEVHFRAWQPFDYYPYLYRGIAYYQNGDRVNAGADLKHEQELGEVNRGTRDTKAAGLLKEFLPLMNEQKRAAPFVEGMRLFNEKDYRGAIQKFGQVPATSPRYDEAKNFIALAQEEIRKLDRSAAASTQAEKARRLAAVKPSPPAADTSNRTALRNAVDLYNAGKFREAKRRLEELRIKGITSPESERYMSEIAATEEKTLMGVTAYCEGDYAMAAGQLAQCARSQSDNPHIFAYLAYSCAANYLVTGQKDTSLARQARDAYRRLQSLSPSYAPDMRYVSPGIVAFLKGE